MKVIKKMNLDPSPQTSSSSESRSTAALARTEAVLALGKQLVTELDLDQSVDTLGRWMAHYVAQLIEEAEHAVGESRREAMAACATAVLELWKHRYEYKGHSPFRQLEPILAAVASLDPVDDTPRYFRAPRAAATESGESEEVKGWLELIDGLDYSAKTLIRYFLLQAASSALDKSKEWVGLAESAGETDGFEGVFVRLLDQEADLLSAPDPSVVARAEMEKRIGRLDSFVQLATILSTTLKERLNGGVPATKRPRSRSSAMKVSKSSKP